MFADAHVCVVGIGGVGSWAAEALARTGIGAITLIDMDDVCVTNTNRQIHALAATSAWRKPR
jgi:tRNA A37 threonylcarbamoyladenosine dehydratase